MRRTEHQHTSPVGPEELALVASLPIEHAVEVLGRFADRSELSALLSSRDDAPEALVAAAAPAARWDCHHSGPLPGLHDALISRAIVGYAARATGIPDGTEVALHQGITRAAVEALPRERALALARQRLAEGPWSLAFQVFAVYPPAEADLARLSRLPSFDGEMDPGWIALGAIALPHLRAVHARRHQSRTAARLITAILAAEAEAGRDWDAGYDTFLSCDLLRTNRDGTTTAVRTSAEPWTGLTPSNGLCAWDSGHAVAVLGAMPEQRRIVAARRLFDSDAHIERAFRCAGTVEQAAFRREAIGRLVARFREARDLDFVARTLQAFGPDALEELDRAWVEGTSLEKLFLTRLSVRLALSGWDEARAIGARGFACLVPAIEKSLGDQRPPTRAEAFGKLTPKRVSALAAKLMKLPIDGCPKRLLEKSGVPPASHDGFLWHVAALGLVSPTHPALRHEMLGSLDSPLLDRDDLFSVVARLSADDDRRPYARLIFQDWSVDFDRLVTRAQELDAWRLLGLLDGASEVLRAGIQLVRGRLGEPLDEADKALVFDRLLACHLAPGIHTCGTDASGRELGSGDLLRTFGGDRCWDEVVVGGIRAALDASEEARQIQASRPPGAEHVYAHELQVERVANVLRALPWPEFASLVERDPDRLAAVAYGREDPPAFLLELAGELSLLDDRLSAQTMKLCAIARFGELGMTIPERLEEGLNWGSAPARCIRALPRERALTLARSLSGTDLRAALRLLSAHPDEATLSSLAAVPSGWRMASVWTIVGAAALAPLLRVHQTAAPEDQKEIACCLLELMYSEAEAGRTFAEVYDPFVSVEAAYGAFQSARFVVLLEAMSERRRTQAIRRLAAEGAPIERVACGAPALPTVPRFELLDMLVARSREVRDWDGIRLPNDAAAWECLVRAVEQSPHPVDPRLFDTLRQTFDKGAVHALRERIGSADARSRGHS